MHAMWKPAKFKYIYLLATLYVFTLTLPSAAAMYWAFGDELLTHSNAFSLLPKTGWRDAAVILMLIHQFITFGFACTPLYFVWEKVIGMHDTKSIFKRALARLPIVVPIWFLAIIFPFFGPINSAVGALLVSFTVYIIPALAHILTYRTASARMVSAVSVSIRSFRTCICICIRRFASLSDPSVIDQTQASSPYVLHVPAEKLLFDGRPDEMLYCLGRALHCRLVRIRVVSSDPIRSSHCLVQYS